MDNIQELANEFTLQNTQVSLWGIVINLILAGFLARILAFIYTKYGNALSNRKAFSKNFIMMATITALIITIVKSSLALSLGLVGALSIVRYRTAIKDPEELAYLFFTIAIGLGLGADMRLITIVAFFVIIFIIWLSSFYNKKMEMQENLYLTIASGEEESIDIKVIINLLKENCASVDIKRFDESGGNMEASFLIELASIKDLIRLKEELQKAYKEIKITFLDNKGVIV